jgi:hypothetical protein
MGNLVAIKNPGKMKSIRLSFNTVIFCMIFHHTVSAGTCLNPFTAARPSYFSTGSDTAKIISFNSITNRKKVSLNWIVAGNQEIDQFEVERSKDGKKFEVAGLIFGTEKEGMDNYYFFEKLKKSKIYYRVKTLAKDGSINYSKIIIAGTI